MRQLSAPTALWGSSQCDKTQNGAPGSPPSSPFPSHYFTLSCNYSPPSLLCHPAFSGFCSFIWLHWCLLGSDFDIFFLVTCQLIVSSGVYLGFCRCLVILRWFAGSTVSKGNLCTIYRCQAHPCDQLKCGRTPGAVFSSSACRADKGPLVYCPIKSLAGDAAV